MSRTITGALLAAATVTAVGLLSGCGAGMQTQTSEQVAPVPGIDTDIPVDADGDGQVDGRIALRNVAIAFPGLAGYQRGGTAPLRLHVFNETGAPLTLSGANLPSGGGTVVLAGGASVTPSAATPSAAVPAGASQRPGPSGSPQPTGAGLPAGASGAPATGGPAGAPGGTTSPTGSPGASQPAAPPGATLISVPVGVSSYAALLPEQGRYLAITGLASPVRPGNAVEVTFNFTLQNGRTVAQTLRVPLDVPLSAFPRTPISVAPADGHE